MNLAALRAWRRVTGSAPAQSLRVPALGLRQWVAAMGHTPGVLRGLSPQGVLLPEPDLAVLIDPLHAAGLDVMPPAVDRVVPEGRGGAPANPRMQSATPVTGARGQGARSGPGPRGARLDSGHQGVESEVLREALDEARRAGNQPARLATILQRYAGGAAQLRARVESPAAATGEQHGNHQLRAGAESPAGRGINSIGVAPQRPAADRKVVYLPARQATSVAVPDAVRAAAAPARWEANMAATLKRWAQAGAAGTGLPGRARQGATAMPSPRLPNSVQAAERATAMSASHPTESADTPASATPSAPAAASAARLAQAVRAALAPAAASAESPHAAAQPVIESLTRIVEQLTSIEMKFSQAASASTATVESREEPPAVQWLEDDDLAGRLQGILRRQAKRRGIDLS